jgi:hypothetical protein
MTLNASRTLTLAAAAALAAAGSAHAAKIKPNAPAALWSIEAEGQTAAAKAAAKIVQICADAAIQAGFSRGLPEIDGKPCVITGRPVNKDELFAARCRVDQTRFFVNSVRTGDPSSDFVVVTTMETRAAGGKRFEQQIHYRKLAPACPAGWTIGDAGSAGATTLKNSITGATHALPAPIAAAR